MFKDFRNQHYREFIEDIGDMEGVDTDQKVITGFVSSKAGSTVPGMPRNYSDNATKSESLIVTSWTKDTTLKRFIG